MSLRKTVILGAAALMLALPLFASAADEDDDHDLARDLHEGGEIRALSDILKSVGRSVEGDIVAVELVRAGKSWVYRIQVVSPDGRRRIIDVDAGKGTVFDDKGRD